MHQLKIREISGAYSNPRAARDSRVTGGHFKFWGDLRPPSKHIKYEGFSRLQGACAGETRGGGEGEIKCAIYKNPPHPHPHHLPGDNLYKRAGGG